MEPADKVPRQLKRRHHRMLLDRALRGLYDRATQEPVPERLRAIVERAFDVGANSVPAGRSVS